MNRFLKIGSFVLLFAALTLRVDAQYFNTGVDPASIRWRQIKDSTRKVIFPSYYQSKARLVNGYLNTLTPYVSNGLSPRMERFDVLLHTGNILSNGVVTWAPKRMELYTAPPASTYPMPWLKQLAAHEYRHVSQMSNLHVGITKIASYFLGEQIVGLVAAIPPKWFFEGDATLAETQFAVSGRGDQPSFSMGLRAILNEREDLVVYDKFSLKSYRDFTPSPYEYGYYMVASSRRYYGDDFWGKILRFTGRNPYFITSATVAYRKYAHTSSPKMFRRTFKELRQFWHNASQEPNSSVFYAVPTTSYTTYRSPLLFGQNIIAQKKDLDQTPRIVAFDTVRQEERILRYAPWMEERVNVRDSVLIWSEYSPSLFWSHRIESVLRQAQLYTKNGTVRLTRPKTVLRSSALFYPTPVRDSLYAVVSYDKMNNPSILLLDSRFEELKRFAFQGELNSFNGLAWDEVTDRIYYILVNENGIGLNSLDLDTEEHSVVLPSSYIAYSQLSAENGRLMFTSTESGKDEVHLFDLKTNEQYRMTGSKYGSFDGRAMSDSSAVVTTYTPKGYLLAEQRFDKDTLTVVDNGLKMPSNRLLPFVKSWGVPKFDTLRIATQDSLTAPKEKRYSKAGHLFKPHSWVPAVLDLNKLIDDRELTIGVGATAISQNTLGTMTSIVGYGWIPNVRRSLLFADLTYTGLPVHIGLKISYGGGDQEIYSPFIDPVATGTKKYFSVKPKLSLPINLSGGSLRRSLEPFVALNYSNALIYGSDHSLVAKSMNKLSYGVSYLSYRPMVDKDLAPNWGYAASVSGVLNPFNGNFGQIYSVYGRLYLPGVAKHHAWSVAANFQYQRTNAYNFIQKELFPRGNELRYAPSKMISSAVNYRLPLAYPEWMLRGLLYVKRISLNAFGEYARCVYPQRQSDNFYTYGGELLFDLHVLRIGGVAFSLGASVYKANTLDKPSVGFLFNFSY